MNDQSFGLLLLGIGILFVLGLVFALTARVGSTGGARPVPPKGVHLPPPSFLPVVMAIGGSLIGAGLAFKPEDAAANWLLLVPGLVVFVLGVFAWVRAANHEWTDTEHGSHDDGGH